MPRTEGHVVRVCRCAVYRPEIRELFSLKIAGCLAIEQNFLDHILSCRHLRILVADQQNVSCRRRPPEGRCLSRNALPVSAHDILSQSVFLRLMRGIKTTPIMSGLRRARYFSRTWQHQTSSHLPQQKGFDTDRYRPTAAISSPSHSLRYSIYTTQEKSIVSLSRSDFAETSRFGRFHLLGRGHIFTIILRSQDFDSSALLCFIVLHDILLRYNAMNSTEM